MDEILNSVTGKSAPALPDKLSESSTDDMRSEFTRLLHCKSLGFYVMKHKLLWEQSNMWYRDKMLDIPL